MPEPVRKDITKKEAACRQIETAIRLFFNEDDAICVHVLVSSAQVIVHDVCVKLGKKPSSDEFEARIRPEYIPEWRRLVKLAYNYFKHADRDADVELVHFDERANDMVLFLTGIDYATAFGAMTTTMAIYHGWYLGIHPEMAHPEHPMLEMIKEQFGDLAGQTRREQLRRGVGFLENIPQIERALAAKAAQDGPPH